MEYADTNLQTADVSTKEPPPQKSGAALDMLHVRTDLRNLLHRGWFRTEAVVAYNPDLANLKRGT